MPDSLDKPTGSLPDLPEHLRSAAERAAETAARGGKADSTLKKYARYWETYTDWLQSHNVNPEQTSPELVCTFLEHLRTERDLAHQTLQGYRAGIVHTAKRELGIHLGGDDLLGAYLSQIQVDQRSRESQKTDPLYPEDLKAILATCDVEEEGIQAVRDRAMLLVGYICALRRSEIVAIRRRHLTPRRGPDGRTHYTLFLPTQKNDVEGKGFEKAIPETGRSTSPARALADLLEMLPEDPDQAVFTSLGATNGVGTALSTQGVWYIFKKRVKQAGLPAERYSPHSLRSGFCTAASEAGAQLPEVMAVSGHADEGAALTYIRSGKLFDNPALEAVGL